MVTKKRRRIHVGTSGWVYSDWCGPFYPDGLGSDQRLPFYARHFDTVEINATFYRLATHAATEKWQAAVPKGFRFVAKGSSFITHRLKLRNCAQAVERYFERLEPLRSLEVVLWQLPQNFPADLARIDEFLGMLPRHVRHAMEFRDPTWWNPDVYEVLRRHEVAFCGVSHPELPDDVVPTTDLLYVRFHGLGEQLYDYHYSDEEMEPWAKAIRRHRRGRDVWVFFNNDWHCQALDNARTFRDMLTQ